MNMYLDNLQNRIEYQGHRSKKVKVTWVFFVFFLCVHGTVATCGQCLVLARLDSWHCCWYCIWCTL